MIKKTLLTGFTFVFLFAEMSFSQEKKIFEKIHFVGGTGIGYSSSFYKGNGSILVDSEGNFIILEHRLINITDLKVQKFSKDGKYIFTYNLNQPSLYKKLNADPKKFVLRHRDLSFDQNGNLCILYEEIHEGSYFLVSYDSRGNFSDAHILKNSPIGHYTYDRIQLIDKNNFFWLEIFWTETSDKNTHIFDREGNFIKSTSINFSYIDKTGKIVVAKGTHIEESDTSELTNINILDLVKNGGKQLESLKLSKPDSDCDPDGGFINGDIEKGIFYCSSDRFFKKNNAKPELDPLGNLLVLPRVSDVAASKKYTQEWSSFKYPFYYVLILNSTSNDLFIIKINIEEYFKKYGDLDNKSQEELRLLTNEIYARYGRPFKNPDIQKYFSTQSWYKVNPRYNDDMLQEEEKFLVKQLFQIEANKPIRASLKDIPISVDIRASNCVEISGPANIRDQENGKVTDTIPDKFFVKLIDIKDDWVFIVYDPQRSSKEKCDSVENEMFSKKGFTDIKNLPRLTLIAANFIPNVGQSKKPLPLISFEGEKTINTSPYYTIFFNSHTGIPKDFNITNVEKTKLFTFDPSGIEENESMSYWIIYTGKKEHPYLFLFSGFANDMYGIEPEIVLFGGKNIKSWKPNAGNRVSSSFIGIKDNYLIINEAFICMFEMQTSLKISSSGIDRVFGTINLKDIKADNSEGKITLYLNKDSDKELATINKGTKIKIHFEELDFKSNRVKAKINDKSGWIDLDKLREAAPQIYDQACCGCG